MRKRLRELKEPVYGLKKELWTRLVNAENKHKQELEFRKALVEQQQRRAEGAQAADVVPVALPPGPSPMERELHELTHCPPAPWCEACVLGQGGEDPHRRVPEEKKGPIPLVMADWGFTGENNGKPIPS